MYLQVGNILSSLSLFFRSFSISNSLNGSLTETGSAFYMTLISLQICFRKLISVLLTVLPETNAVFQISQYRVRKLCCQSLIFEMYNLSW